MAKKAAGIRRNPLRLGERIKRVINKDAIFLSHVIVGTIVIFDIALSPAISLSQKITIYCLLGLVAAMGVSRYFNLFKINSYPAIHLTLYHLLIGAGLAFFAPVGSMYPFVWLIILFLTNFYYGNRTTGVSLLVLLVVLEVQLLRTSYTTGLLVTDVIAAVAQFGIIFAVSMFFVDAQAVTEYDRKLLMRSIDKAQLDRERLISLINNMSDGVLATDDKGVIKLYNAAALNLLDTNIDLAGKDIRRVMKVVDKDNRKLDVIKWGANENIGVQSTDYQLAYKDDEAINLYLTISPIKLGFHHDTERGFIISFRDITREKSLEEERNEFISVISHELRTPVAITEASISNVRYIMDHGRDKVAVNAALDQAYKQVLFLANMLNDLSTLSRAERGKLDFAPEQISPHEVMQSLYDDYHAEVETKGMRMHMDITATTPVIIVSNKLYLREVLQNFVTNSIKYTREGSVTITSEGSKGGVLFKVIDTGIGINKSDQKKIFKKFFRSEDFRTRESSGTGLGLYITRKLAKLLEAEISVESQINKGSVFSIFIPDLSSRYPGSLGTNEPAKAAATAGGAAKPAKAKR